MIDRRVEVGVVADLSRKVEHGIVHRDEYPVARLDGAAPALRGRVEQIGNGGAQCARLVAPQRHHLVESRRIAADGGNLRLVGDQPRVERGRDVENHVADRDADAPGLGLGVEREHPEREILDRKIRERVIRALDP